MTTTINNFCTGCDRSIHPRANSCLHCGALQGGDISTPLITAQSYPDAYQTHLFLTSATAFKVRWTYWVWWSVAVVSFFVGYGFYVFGAAVMLYLFVSSLIRRKRWQHDQLLATFKTSKRA